MGPIWFSAQGETRVNSALKSETSPGRSGSSRIVPRVLLLVWLVAGSLAAMAGCRSGSTAVASVEAGARLTTQDIPTSDAATTPDAWTDCISVLHVADIRGCLVANVQRFGETNSALRTTSRISDLASGDLQAFCDWEACLRTNGYDHTCWVNDAGWERCRVCDGAADCNGDPMTQSVCVAHAAGPVRSSCHVGLLQECLIQRSLRGPADPRVTQSCQRSEQACAGQLPGDVSSQALAAQHETDQVTVQLCKGEVASAARLVTDADVIGQWGVMRWEQTLSAWDGGLPPGEADAEPTEAGPSDSGSSDAEAGDP